MSGPLQDILHDLNHLAEDLKVLGELTVAGASSEDLDAESALHFIGRSMQRLGNDAGKLATRVDEMAIARATKEGAR
jgi:hypothetical protein